MNSHSDDMERIEDAAAEWLVERAAGLSAARTREFERWRQLDPRHAEALARAEQTWALLEEMPQIRSELQPVVEFPIAKNTASEARARSRGTPWIRVALGLAAVVAIAALGWWQWPAAKHYSTASGGYERVVLADGSVLELNSDTEVRVNFARHERRLELMHGEAHFSVAHDTTRPFVVNAQHVSVRAVGTAFNVRLATAVVEVLVTEGKVQLGKNSGAATAGPLNSEALGLQQPNGRPTLLNANERLLIPAPGASQVEPNAKPVEIERVSPAVIRAALAWQERKLVFADTPLREVVAQFNLRNRLQIVIADAAIAERPVGGTFAADNAEGFVRLLAEGGAIAVERRGEFEILLHAVR
ncbi:MAG: FecR domain-containing protein [Opitutae bacterium]|nr:FecR domain-containing protein [Opitutae bacterium]